MELIKDHISIDSFQKQKQVWIEWSKQWQSSFSYCDLYFFLSTIFLNWDKTLNTEARRRFFYVVLVLYCTWPITTMACSTLTRLFSLNQYISSIKCMNAIKVFIHPLTNIQHCVVGIRYRTKKIYFGRNGQYSRNVVCAIAQNASDTKIFVNIIFFGLNW